MLPASALEKVLTAVIYSFVFFPLVYFITVYPVVILMHFVDVKIIGNINLLYHPRWKELEIIFLFAFFLLQSFSLLCSIMFRRYVFLKAAVIVFITFFGIIYLNSRIAESSLKGLQPRNLTIQEKKNNFYAYRNSSPYRTLHFRKFKSDKSYEVKLPEYQRMGVGIAKWLLIPFFWLLTWLKLREKQL